MNQPLERIAVAGPARRTGVSVRDDRLDLFRGLALFLIFSDRIPATRSRR